MSRSCVGLPLIFAMSSAPAFPAACTEAVSGIPSEDELDELNGLMQEDEAELCDEDPFGHTVDNAHAPLDLHWLRLAGRAPLRREPRWLRAPPVPLFSEPPPIEDELDELMQEDEAELCDEDPFGHTADNAHAPLDLNWQLITINFMDGAVLRLSLGPPVYAQVLREAILDATDIDPTVVDLSIAQGCVTLCHGHVVLPDVPVLAIKHWFTDCGAPGLSPCVMFPPPCRFHFRFWHVRSHLIARRQAARLARTGAE
jgi:hypothetical protein